MNTTQYYNTIIALSLAGTLFAGYLTISKLITGTCAFSEPCPYFLGYPSCWYGFAMFAIILLASLRGRFSKGKNMCKTVLRTVSVLGTFFAGYSVALEVPAMFGSLAPSYGMGLPTCAYGLVFYVAILVLSFVSLEDASSVVVSPTQ